MPSKHRGYLSRVIALIENCEAICVNFNQKMVIFILWYNKRDFYKTQIIWEKEMKKSIFLLAFLLSMLWHVPAVAEECDVQTGFCFGINWKTATLADVQGINVRAKDEYGGAPLHWAAGDNKNPDIINALIQTGANINARDKSGNTPLHFAAYNENPDIINALIQSGADIHARDKSGNTPLHNAATRKKNLNFINVLIQSGVNIDKVRYLAATRNNNPDITNALVQAGANINARDKSGYTPLHNAASNENPNIINALIQAGADIHAKAEDGETPLHWAAGNNENPDIINALIQAGADIHATNKYGSMPLHFAATSNNNPDIIKALVQAGANINARDKSGYTPLHEAAPRDNNLDIINALIQAGADINAREQLYGNTPLHRMVLANQQQAVLLLLENGADATISNANGKTPLALADENTDFQNSEAYWALNDASYAPAGTN